ncbi:MAG: hypothetical protein WAK55_20915, partial [Xanthobacteraceae bacterium]
AYVTREQGAAELQISPSTWDDFVACGLLPQPRRLGGSILRWRWDDVDKAIRGEDADTDREPYFRDSHGSKAKRGRDAA